MSQELAQAFFERDLSAAELDALEASLAADPAVAERLLAGAESDYRATGLPVPRWAERAPSRGKGWLWLAALALGGGALALSLRQAPQAISVVGADEQPFAVTHTVPLAASGLEVESAAAPAPASSSAPSRSGSSLGVVLRLREASDVRVTVADEAGRVRRKLFQGTLQAGEQRVLWDGKDDQGRGLPAADYTVRVQGPSLDLRRMVTLRASAR